MLGFLLLIGQLRAQKDLISGEWEVIPIAEDLEDNTEYSVAYIDDLPNLPESTMDMFVFQPAHDVTWIKTIRGSSLNAPHKIIPDSKGFLSRVVYFTSPDLPDLLQISADQHSIKLIRNKVYYNLQQLKKDLLTGELQQDELEDWPQTLLYGVHGDLTFIDIIATDINSDGIMDALAVLKRNDGKTFMLEVVFTNAAHTSFFSTELAFESPGMKQVLGVFDVNKDGKNDFVYLSTYNQLAYVANFDPIYTSEVIWGEPLDIGQRLKTFYILDFDGDGLTDFVIPVSDNLLLIKQKTPQIWEKKVIITSHISDFAMTDVKRDGSRDFLVLWGTQVTLLAQTEAHVTYTQNSEFTFTWTKATGGVFGYRSTVLELESTISWSRLVAADLVGNGNLDLVLYSSSARMIGWARRSLNGSDLGWNPNFWMFLMVYVLAMSLILGLAHTTYLKKLKQSQLMLKNLPPGLEFKPPESSAIEDRGKAKRKITV